MNERPDSTVVEEALQAFRAESTAAHLDFDTQLLPYAENRLDAADREVVESHLDDCAMCRAEAEDLRRFHEARTQSHPNWRWMWIAAAALAMLALLALFVLRERPSAHTPEPSIVKKPAPPVVTPTPPLPQRDPYPKREWAQLADAAMASHRLPYPDTLADLATSPDDLRGGEGTATRNELAPAGVIVRTQRPRFTWRAHDGATYVVAVFANDVEVARSPALHDASWTPSQDLPRGQTFVWQLDITRGGTTERVPVPPAPPAMFRITTDADERAIAEALTARPDDPLLHALVFAQAGLRADAERALAAARKAGDPRAVQLQ